MTNFRLGTLFMLAGLVLLVSLAFLYYDRNSAAPVDQKTLLQALSASEHAPQQIYLPKFDLLNDTENEGLWGFERITRQNSRITKGKYTQLCQNKEEILQQAKFWLNAPHAFVKKYPNVNYVNIRASKTKNNQIQHHFAVEHLAQTKSGLNFIRYETQITWTLQKDHYELIIKEAYAVFSSFHPKNNLSWLSKIKNDLDKKPLINRGDYSEKKMIAFRLEDCNR